MKLKYILRIIQFSEAHKIQLLIPNVQKPPLNSYMNISSRVSLIPSPSLPLLLCVSYARSEGSGETVHMHGSPEPALLVDVISTNILFAGPYFVSTVNLS